MYFLKVEFQSKQQLESNASEMTCNLVMMG